MDKYKIEYQDTWGNWREHSEAVGMTEAINEFRRQLLGMQGHLAWRITSPEIPSAPLREI